MPQALTGGSPENFSGKAGTTLLTTTSQYRVVGILSTTTTSDLTFELASTSTVKGFGVCQTALSATAATPVHIRLFGVGKVFCASTVTVGDFVQADYATGAIQTVTEALTATAGSLTSHSTVLGRALQSGVTSQAITIFINPSLREKTFAAE